MTADWHQDRVRRHPGGSSAQQNGDPEKDLARGRRTGEKFQVEGESCAGILVISTQYLHGVWCTVRAYQIFVVRMHSCC